MSLTAARWKRFLVVILLGNGLYYASYPHLPFAAQHQPFRPDLGIVVDLWFCLLVYGILELAAFLNSRRRRD